jgi:hypothetical protein
MRQKFLCLTLLLLPVPVCAQTVYTGYAYDLPPLNPTDTTQCDAFRSRYDAQIDRITTEHQQCLDLHTNDPSMQVNNTETDCSRAACQWLHTQMYHAKSDRHRIEEAQSSCNHQVQRYKDQIQQQKEQAAQLLAKQQQEQQDAAALLQQQQKQNQSTSSKPPPNSVTFSKASIDALEQIRAIKLLTQMTQTLVVLQPAYGVVSVDNPVDAVTEANDVYSFSSEDWEAFAEFISRLTEKQQDTIHAIALATLAELQHYPKNKRNKAEEAYWGQMIEDLEK